MAWFAKMLRNIVAFIFFFALCLHSTAPVQGPNAGALGEDCLPGSPPTCNNTADHVCDTNLQTAKCKIRNGATCTTTDSNECVDGATCSGQPLTCTCGTGRVPTHAADPLCAAKQVQSGSGSTQATPTQPTGSSGGNNQGNPVLVGQECDASITGACTANATCISNNTCQCDQNYSARKDGTCGLNVGQHCNTNDDCVDHATCPGPSTSAPAAPPSTFSYPAPPAPPSIFPYPAPPAPPSIVPYPAPPAPTTTNHYRARRVPNQQCTCNDDFYKSNSICIAKLPVNSNCKNSDECTPGANCTTDGVGTVCKCMDSYYKNDTNYCLSRIKPGLTCPQTADGEDHCVDGARCSNSSVCQCVDHQYRQIGEECKIIQEDGKPCSNNSECADNAYCHPNTSNCHCYEDFFYNKSIRQCLLRKPLGATCNETTQCVIHANCSNNTCVCDDQFYDQNQRCNRRLQLNHQCDSAIPKQCLTNGECVNGLCQCNRNSYSNRVSCQTTLKFNANCDLEISDLRQCESNTTCGFHSSTPKCGCDIHHFFNGQYCVKRALAGDSCPYTTISSMGLNITRTEFEKQCVENAYCNTVFQVCECKTGFYDRNGRCPSQIELDGICDPWTNYPNQCKHNGQCLYGRCVAHQ